MILEMLETRAHPGTENDMLTGVFGGTTTASGAQITEANALEIMAVYACVRVLAESIASLPLNVYRRLKAGGKDKDLAHPRHRLLHDQPNRWQTSYEFREMMVGHLALRGNAYALIRPWRGDPFGELIPQHPDKIGPRKENGHYVFSKNGLVYDLEKADGTTDILFADEVMHWRGLSTDGVMGMSPVSLMRESLGLAKATEEYGARFFANDAKPGGFISVPTKLNKDDRERTRASWQKAQTGENRHKTAVLEHGITWQQVGVNSEDAQFLETRKFQRAEIAGWFRIPPHMIGDLEKATFSNIEHQSLEFVVHTLRPWLVRIEQAILRDLFTPQGRRTHYARFVVDGLLRGDTASRYAAYAVGRQWGWLNADDVRGFEDQNPIPDGAGQAYLQPLNMVEAGSAPPVSTERSILRSLPASQERSVGGRQRIRQTWLPIFKEGAARFIRRDVKGAQRALKDGAPGFLTWLNDHFGEAREEDVTRDMLPAFTGYAESIRAEAGDVLGTDIKEIPSLDNFAASYTRTFAKRNAGKLSAKLRKIFTGSQDWEKDLNLELDDWLDTMPGRESSKELVRSGEAFIVAAFRDAGVHVLRWVATSDCQICAQMDGKVVEVGHNFAEVGDRIDPGKDDVTPLDVSSRVGHPPLHDGCECLVLPG